MYDTWASVSWVHRYVLHREENGNREDGSIRDGGVKMNETEQKKDARHSSKHGQVHRAVLGWWYGLLRVTNHPIVFAERSLPVYAWPRPRCHSLIIIKKLTNCKSRAPAISCSKGVAQMTNNVLQHYFSSIFQRTNRIFLS